MNRKIALLLALLITLGSVLMGCSGSKKPDNDQGNTQNQTKEQSQNNGQSGSETNAEPQPITEFPDNFPAAPKPVGPSVYAYDDLKQKYKIEIMLQGSFNLPHLSDDPIKKYLDEKFNADVVLTNLTPADLKSAIAVRYSSGQAPDVVKLPAHMKSSAIQLFDQGQLMETTEVLSYMPQLATYVTKAFKDWATVNGKMIGIPRYGTFPDNWWGFVRKDWLEKFDMKIPTTENELYEYAKAVVERDPNENGKPDTFFGAAASGGGGLGMLDGFRAMYGHPDFHIEDGKISHPMINGAAKSYLQFIKKLNDEKLLAPDWYTIQSEPFKAVSMNDQIGFVFYPGYNLVYETVMAHPNDKEKYAHVWEPLGVLKSNDGKGGKLLPGNAPDSIFLFSKTLEKDQAKMKRVTHLIDTCIYPNVNYWAVSQGGGKEIWPDLWKEQKFNEDGTNIFDRVPGTYEDPKLKPTINALEDWQFMGYTLIWQVFGDKPAGEVGSELNKKVVALPRYDNYRMKLNLNARSDARLTEFTIRNEVAFVLGKRSFDEWDKYVEEWKNSGGQKLLEEAAEQLGVQKP